MERAAKKLPLEESSAGATPSDVAAEAFLRAVRYHNRSWPKHGSNGSNSNSSSNSSNSSSNNNTTTTCAVALLRPFDPGKGCQRDSRRGKAVIGLDLPFDRGKHDGGCSMEGDELRAEGEFFVLFD